MKNKRTLWIVLAAAGLVALIAVVVILTRPQGSSAARGIATPSAAASAPATVTPTPSPTPTPTPTPTAIPIPADALLVITGTANDVSGAKLAIRIVVHQPVGKDDPSAAADLAQLTGQCSSNPNWTVEVEPESGIGHTDVAATAVGSTPWPMTSEIQIYPGNGAQLGVVSGTGISASLVENSAATTTCAKLPAIFGPANGTSTNILWARPGFNMPVQSPNRYLWETNTFGFAAIGAGGNANPSLTISDCTVVVTDAANAFGFDPSAWQSSTSQDHVSCTGSGGPRP